MLRIILFSMAVGSGGFAAWLAGAAPQDGPPALSAAEMPAPAIEEVLVAALDIEQGATLLPEHTRWQAWPADAVQEGFFTRSTDADAAETLAGSVVRARLIAGAPVLAESVAPAKSNLLSAVLSAGMRAVAIRVSAEKTAGGFILPNDRVDVLLAVPCLPENGCSGGMAVRTILKNVRVLAIDQSDGEANGEGVLIGKTATLELDPAQTEAIVGAEASGTLSLVLRSAADRAEALDPATDQSRVVRVRREGVTEYVTVR